MTKADFGRVFPNVRQTISYRERGVYHYVTVPKSALPFLIRNAWLYRPRSRAHGELGQLRGDTAEGAFQHYAHE